MVAVSRAKRACSAIWTTPADDRQADRSLIAGSRFTLGKASGVFVAGDVRYGSIKRVASAVGDGARAVSLVHRWLTTDGAPQP